MIYSQLLLDVHNELIVDLFAGGGGASCGIEMATGRNVDVAINHDAAAVAMHRANHPQTDHHVSDVFEVDPREVTGGRPVGLLWASPDCTYHSKARGAKPIRHRNRKRRALAWVVTRWAGQVRPRVIALENVEEFAEWGPLVGPPDALRPCPRRRGRTFRKWVRSLERLGYQVEWRELRACDYGAPTIRKRLFLIARCDGEPIVWPKPTHGKGKGLKPFRTAAECIDWSIPMCSIFATKEEARAWGQHYGQAAPKRPLADATMRRIARGVQRFVLDNPRPFIVPNNTNNRPHSIDGPVPTVTGGGRNILAAPVLAGVGGRAGQSPERPLTAPMQTLTAKGDAALVAPYLVPRYGEREGQAPRTRSIEEPSPVVVPSGNGATLAAAFLAKHFTGVDGAPLPQPAPTVTTIDHSALVTVNLENAHGFDGSRSEAHRYGRHSSDGSGRGVEAQEPESHPVTEPAPAGDKNEGRLPGREAVLGRQAVPDLGSQARVDRAARPYPGRDGGEPHRRREDEQRPVESGAGYSAGEYPACAANRPDSATRLRPESAREAPEAGARPPAGRTHVRGYRKSAGNLPDERISPHAGRVAGFVSAYYGTDQDQAARSPLATITTKDRHSLVTVDIQGEPYVIADIAMRMLQPRELYRAQGFPDSYVIDRGADGRKLTKTEQVRMVGNSVVPQLAAALVRANAPELVARDEVRRSA